ncbi:MAG: aminotransferase class I/II-fold pyridoxal phosphate-dependent enzyme [Planctomycetes bacterium]|nr:aminotransferase class I/II-fold pyridoxal phosphate-dependent enzyme [Planctomycetota bacterium]
MSVPIADFRSDTSTLPTEAMRRAMATAEVGDDVRGEDPTVRRLEQEAAALLGKPAALFLPSGTMANQAAIHVHCRPGDELICEDRSHVYLFEGGGIARLSGTQVRLLAAPGGFPTPAQVEGAVRSDDPHHPRSRLLVLENTHNMAGGRVANVATMSALAAAARRHGLAVHVDGARLLNAAVALGCPARDLVASADSVSLCLSKGLGAPVGSMLAGSTDFVAQARRVRKAFGGGMRQAGVIAAAGLLALRDGPALLAHDHDRAQRLARGLAELPFLAVDPAVVDSNIVMADLRAGEPDQLQAHLQRCGVLAAGAGPRRLRFVLHRDVDDAMVQRCLDACRTFVPAASPTPSPS